MTRYRILHFPKLQDALWLAVAPSLPDGPNDLCLTQRHHLLMARKTETGKMVLKQIGYISLNVSDMQRSVEFYRDKLQLKVESESPHRSVLSLDGSTKIALHKGLAREKKMSEREYHEAGICSIGFMVDDLNKAMSDLQSRGIVFSKPPSPRGGGRSLVVELLDPDGFQIAISGPGPNL